MSYHRNTRTIATALVRAVRESQLTMLAAGIAYYAFISLFPLLLLSIVVATTIGGEAVANAVVSGLGDVLSPSGEALARRALLAADARGGATLVGVGVLLWGGLKLFRGLDMAFSMVYGTAARKSLLGQLRNAVTALAAVGVAIGTTVVVGVVASVVGIEFAGFVGTIALVVVLTGAFFPLYYIFPDVAMTPRDALPGAAFAAVGWTVLSGLFQVYAATASGFDLYGIVGAVLLLVTWFYIGGIVLLLGAVLNGVLSGDVGAEGLAGDRQLQQGSLRDTGQRAMTEAGDDERETASDERDVEQLREELADLEDRIEERTLHRDEVESDLKRYVRRRVRRGHATDWGPYLVLLYGTVMTLGAFYFLSSGWAVLAMLVIWLSTLGLYVLMLLVGFTVNVVGFPGRLLDRIRDFRG